MKEPEVVGKAAAGERIHDVIKRKSMKLQSNKRLVAAEQKREDDVLQGQIDMAKQNVDIFDATAANHRRNYDILVLDYGPDEAHGAPSLPQGPSELVPRLKLPPLASRHQAPERGSQTERADRLHDDAAGIPKPPLTDRPGPRLPNRESRPQLRADRVPTDFRGLHKICSLLLKSFALQAEQAGFTPEACSARAVVDAANEVIAKFNSHTAPRFPSPSRGACLRRAMQAADDQRALRTGL